MVCAIDFFTHINETSGATGILSYPNTCFGYFWVSILLGFWLVIVLTIFFKEQDENPKPEMISIFGVASIPIFILSMVATRLEMLTNDGMAIMFTFTGLWLVLWFIKK